MNTSRIDDLRVTSPCPQRWSELEGDGARRYCDQCRLHVHDLSALRRDQAQALLERRREGERLCVTYLPAADGKPLTAERLPAALERPAPGTRPLPRWLRACAAFLVGCLPLLAGCRDEPPAPAPQPTDADPEDARIDQPRTPEDHDPRIMGGIDYVLGEAG